MTFVILYVDGLVITRSDTKMIDSLQENFARNFKITNLELLGLPHYFLHMEVWQQLGDIFIFQVKHT